jgi:hypothetical protein
MLLWTVRTTIISIVLIMIIHNLVCFFTKMLTVPKLKDLVYAPTYKYNKMYDTITSNPSHHDNLKRPGDNDNTTSIDNLYVPQNYTPGLPNAVSNDTSNMKNELKNFLKKQLKPTTDMPAAAIQTSNGNYSDY